MGVKWGECFDGKGLRVLRGESIICQSWAATCCCVRLRKVRGIGSL